MTSGKDAPFMGSVICDSPHGPPSLSFSVYEKGKIPLTSSHSCEDYIR